MQIPGGITNITATPDYCFKGVYCIKDLLAERSGYAQNVTGGLGGYIYFVNTTEDDPTNPKPGSLRYALIQTQPLWIFFLVNGTIYLKDRISLTSHKTIDGRGAQITITGTASLSGRGQAFRIYDAENIIIVNIRFDSVDAVNIDAIEIRRSTNIWIHHCDFTNWSDGAVDLAEASTTRLNNITISWSRFWNHNKVHLIGNSPTRTTDRNFRVTLHHNFYFMTRSRHPRLRFGIVDAFNNLFYWVGEYGAGITMQGLVYAEANIFVVSPKHSTFTLADCTLSAEAPGYFLNVSNRIIYNPDITKSIVIKSCLTNITYKRPYNVNVEPPTDDLMYKIMRYAGTDFPATPKLTILHPQTREDYIWDKYLPTSTTSLTVNFGISLPPYTSPNDEITYVEWYMGDGTKYAGTLAYFLSYDTSDLRQIHTYAQPGVYIVTAILRTIDGRAIIISSTIYANTTITQTVINTPDVYTIQPSTVTTTITMVSITPVTTTVITPYYYYTTVTVTPKPTTVTATVLVPITYTYVTTATRTLETTTTIIEPTTITTVLLSPTTVTYLTTITSPTTYITTTMITTTVERTTVYTTTTITTARITYTTTEVETRTRIVTTTMPITTTVTETVEMTSTVTIPTTTTMTITSPTVVTTTQRIVEWTMTIALAVIAAAIAFIIAVMIMRIK
jgi:pectate lyase